MKKDKFQKLSGNDLDKLLNRAFLELDLGEAGKEAMLQTISKQVLVKQHPGVWIATELFYTKIFFVISILSLTGSFFTWLYKQGPKSDVETTTVQTVNSKQLAAKPTKKTISVNVVDKKPSEKNTQEKNDHAIFTKKELLHTTTTTTITKEEKQSPLIHQPTNEAPLVKNNAEDAKEQPKDPEQKTVAQIVIPETYIFPNLTQKQRKENESEKKWMAKFASRLKQDKGVEKYVRIPVVPDRSMKEFYMASGEVTNLSYRTFLFDLLLNDRREEFLIAKPNQSLWINAAGVHLFDTLSAVYFSDHQYDDYPVVNISVAGAELYCEWLTTITNQIREKDGKPPIRIRLPYEKEWLYAANVGHNDAVYPWFTDSIQNNKNRFLANFCIKKQAEQFKQPISYPNGFDPDAYTAAGMAANNPKIATFLAWSYEPNDFQLYNMCGNVSEMVYTDNKKLKAKGGNWNSNLEELKLTVNPGDSQEILKPSPMLGFRVCVVEMK